MFITFAPLIRSPWDTTVSFITAVRLCADINVDVSIQRGRWIFWGDIEVVAVTFGGRVGSFNAACNGMASNSIAVIIIMDGLYFRKSHTDPTLMQAQSMYRNFYIGLWIFYNTVFHIVPVQAPGHGFQ